MPCEISVPTSRRSIAAKSYAILTEGDGRSSPNHLDPRVLAAFQNIAAEFEAIFDELRK